MWAFHLWSTLYQIQLFFEEPSAVPFSFEYKHFLLQVKSLFKVFLFTSLKVGGQLFFVNKLG